PDCGGRLRRSNEHDTGERGVTRGIADGPVVPRPVRARSVGCGRACPGPCPADGEDRGVPGRVLPGLPARLRCRVRRARRPTRRPRDRIPRTRHGLLTDADGRLHRRHLDVRPGRTHRSDVQPRQRLRDRKSTRLNSSHVPYTTLFRSEEYRAAYYQDSLLVSDAEYDELVGRLEDLETEYPELVTDSSPTQTVGCIVDTSTFDPVEHIGPMYSLDNVFEIGRAHV